MSPAAGPGRLNNQPRLPKTTHAKWTLTLTGNPRLFQSKNIFKQYDFTSFGADRRVPKRVSRVSSPLNSQLPSRSALSTLLCHRTLEIGYLGNLWFLEVRISSLVARCGLFSNAWNGPSYDSEARKLTFFGTYLDSTSFPPSPNFNLNWNSTQYPLKIQRF